MSLAAEKVAEMLALSVADRAFLARQLIASLDETLDSDAEEKWREAIERRSQEIEEGQVSCRPIEETIAQIRAKLNARREPS